MAQAREVWREGGRIRASITAAGGCNRWPEPPTFRAHECVWCAATSAEALWIKPHPPRCTVFKPTPGLSHLGCCIISRADSKAPPPLPCAQETLAIFLLDVSYCAAGEKCVCFVRFVRSVRPARFRNETSCALGSRGFVRQNAHSSSLVGRIDRFPTRSPGTQAHPFCLFSASPRSSRESADAHFRRC